MTAFVFKPTNELIGKFPARKVDDVVTELRKFLAGTTVPPNSYVEAAGRKWTITSLTPLTLHDASGNEVSVPPEPKAQPLNPAPPTHISSGRVVSVILLLFALSVLVLAAFLNPGPDNAAVPVHDARNIERITGSVVFNREFVHAQDSERINDIKAPFSWRFFHWHLIGPNNQMTDFDWWLLENWHVTPSTAAQIRTMVDVTNPTMFHLFAIILTAACISVFASRHPRSQ